MPRTVRARRQQRAERGPRASPRACRAPAASGTCARAARTTGDTRVRDARSSQVPPTIAPATAATPSSAHTTSRIQRPSPTSRMLAPSALNQASRPQPSASARDEPRRRPGPTTRATTCPMSKNVWSRRRSARDRSSASSAIAVSTAFSPVVRSVCVGQPLRRVARGVVRVAVADRREVEAGHVVALEDREVGVVRQPAIDLDREGGAARVRRRPRPRLHDPAVAGSGLEQHRRCRPMPVASTLM